MSNYNKGGNQIVGGSGNMISVNNNSATNNASSEEKHLEKQHIIDLIAAGKLEQALLETVNTLDDEDMQNTAVLLLGKYNILKLNKIKGIVSSQEENLETSKITNGCLELLNRM